MARCVPFRRDSTPRSEGCDTSKLDSVCAASSIHLLILGPLLRIFFVHLENAENRTMQVRLKKDLPPRGHC